MLYLYVIRVIHTLFYYLFSANSIISMFSVNVHRTVIKFCVQAGRSAVETKTFFDTAGDGPRMSRTIISK